MVTTWAHDLDPVVAAQMLDDKRLNAQRGNEGLVVVRALVAWDRGEPRGYQHHPAVVMWRGHLRALCEYQCVMAREWRSRGYQDGCLPEYLERWRRAPDTGWPPWWGDHAIHETHRLWLVSRRPEHYAHLWPDLPVLHDEPVLKWPADPTQGERSG